MTHRRQVFVVRLRAAPKVDAIRALRSALKLLGRRFGLRAISIRAEPEREQAKRRTLKLGGNGNGCGVRPR